MAITYEAATEQVRQIVHHHALLRRGLTAEHRELAYLAGRLQPGMDGGEAASVSEWIATLFAGHVAKENDLLLPALTGSGGDLAALLADMHQPQAAAQA
jgi:hypothetical protein